MRRSKAGKALDKVEKYLQAEIQLEVRSKSAEVRKRCVLPAQDANHTKRLQQDARMLFYLVQRLLGGQTDKYLAIITRADGPDCIGSRPPGCTSSVALSPLTKGEIAVAAPSTKFEGEASTLPRALHHWHQSFAGICNHLHGLSESFPRSVVGVRGDMFDGMKASRGRMPVLVGDAVAVPTSRYRSRRSQPCECLTRLMADVVLELFHKCSSLLRKA